MSKDLKSFAFIEEHKLREKVILGEANTFDIPNDLYESVVLGGAGISLEQLKKKERLEGELLAGVTLVAGEQAATRMKENPDLSEIGFNYNMGTTNSQVAGIFNRDGKDHSVVTVSTKTNSAEMKRVCAHINQLFEEVNT
ncbi:hypothetical protein [Pseudomonas phage vB_PaeM_PS119XW]|uniref:Uncharacterized protein n=1 Tax=Pseudomonas phage vB_PaeM_PS119XW TaxID=2601632 RepID=A0A5C1K839_9CAUD|nr:hypothetical protein PP933_gp220 [Pseudomonas phage vB_PaeM_PS119XW]QEM41949.1 hypothetical protein [Pseudomonas phage vB_PaeM_PS119XW]